MFAGAASATLVAGRPLWRLAQSRTENISGQALTGCNRISLQIYLIQDLAFAVLPHIPCAGSTERLTQLLVAALINGLRAGVIALFWRRTVGSAMALAPAMGPGQGRSASAQPLAPCPLA